MRGARVLDLQENEAAAFDGLDRQPTAETRDRGVEGSGRARLVTEERGVVLECEITDDRGEHAVALHDSILRFVVLARVPDRAPSDDRVGLVAERLDDVGIELDEGLRFVDLWKRLRVGEGRRSKEEDDACDDGPMFADCADGRKDAGHRARFGL